MHNSWPANITKTLLSSGPPVSVSLREVICTESSIISCNHHHLNLFIPVLASSVQSALVEFGLIMC